jgi:Fibrillar collagen C-terminal domain
VYGNDVINVIYQAEFALCKIHRFHSTKLFICLFYSIFATKIVSQLRPHSKIIFKGPDPLSGDEPVRIFGKEITEEERKKLVVKAYEQLKRSYERFKQPDGEKTSPARTCRDLAIAHPDKPSGNDFFLP